VPGDALRAGLGGAAAGESRLGRVVSARTLGGVRCRRSGAPCEARSSEPVQPRLPDRVSRRGRPDTKDASAATKSGPAGRGAGAGSGSTALPARAAPRRRPRLPASPPGLASERAGLGSGSGAGSRCGAGAAGASGAAHASGSSGGEGPPGASTGAAPGAPLCAPSGRRSQCRTLRQGGRVRLPRRPAAGHALKVVDRPCGRPPSALQDTPAAQRAVARLAQRSTWAQHVRSNPAYPDKGSGRASCAAARSRRISRMAASGSACIRRVSISAPAPALTWPRVRRLPRSPSARLRIDQQIHRCGLPSWRACAAGRLKQRLEATREARPASLRQQRLPPGITLSTRSCSRAGRRRPRTRQDHTQLEQTPLRAGWPLRG